MQNSQDSIQYTVHSTQRAAQYDNSTQHTAHSTQKTIQSIQYTVHSAYFYNTICAVCSTQSVVYNTQTVHSTQYTEEEEGEEEKEEDKEEEDYVTESRKTYGQ